MPVAGSAARPGVRRLKHETTRLSPGFRAQGTRGGTPGWVPGVDIREFDDRFQLVVDVPGVDPDGVGITLADGILTITGERLREAYDAGDRVIHRHTECRTGRFYRRLLLPDTVDAENIEATARHGVLEISMPKQPGARVRRIRVAA